MTHKARQVLIFSADGITNVPALLVPFDDRIVAVEACPIDYQRRFGLHGRSRVYLFGSDIKIEEVAEVEISQETWEAARNFVLATNRLHADASIFGPLGTLLEDQGETN